MRKTYAKTRQNSGSKKRGIHSNSPSRGSIKMNTSAVFSMASTRWATNVTRTDASMDQFVKVVIGKDERIALQQEIVQSRNLDDASP